MLGDLSQLETVERLIRKGNYQGPLVLNYVAIGGGGLRGGLAIGATDPLGESEIPEDPVPVENIHATIFDRFGIDYGYELMTPIGRPIAISDGRPIRELL